MFKTVERNKRMHEIAVQTMNRSRRWRGCFATHAARAKPAACDGAPPQDIVAGAPDALVSGIGTELVEDDELPDGGRVLWGVARTGLLESPRV